MARVSFIATAIASLFASTCSAQWTILGSVSTNGGLGFEVDGAHAYLSDGKDGLRIIDVSNVGSMSVVSTLLPSPVRGFQVALTDDPDIVIYITLECAHWKVNVSNAALPVALAVYRPPTMGQMAYVVGNYSLVPCDSAGLLVIDLTTMTLAATLVTGGYARYVDVVGSYAFVAIGSPTLVVDISNILAPSIVATIPVPGLSQTVHVHNNIAWVGMAPNFFLVDVSNPLAPVGLSTIPLQEAIYGLKFYGTNAYVAAGGLYVFDNSLPTAPVLCSVYAPPSFATVAVAVTPAAVFVSNAEGGPSFFALSGPSFCDTPAPPTVAPTPAPPTGVPSVAPPTAAPTSAPATAGPPTPAPATTVPTAAPPTAVPGTAVPQTAAPTPVPTTSNTAPVGLSPAGGSPQTPPPAPTPAPTTSNTAPIGLSPAGGGPPPPPVAAPTPSPTTANTAPVGLGPARSFSP
ncbi:hypothetical protein DIPPA_15983 [Diplonema papillatum]|nr:hypothetical protein DIPPA_16004 [Diplonema papillatum]KAJ9464372.1 hypothetical protein DIPPA_15983 [Diplonema papillatum]